MTLVSAAKHLEHAFPDLPEARIARERCLAPWTVVLVGRRSAGKTTLVNQLADTHLPTGLGGVTSEAQEVSVGDVHLLDTPGIGGRGAIDRLMPLVEDADAVLWVVDGLHPLTLSERRVMRECLRPGTPLAVAVTHLDLVDPEDVDDVLARVSTLASPLGADPILRVDARAGRIPEGLVRPGDTSPARRAKLRRAADAADAALVALGPLALEALRSDARAIWTATVASMRADLEQAIDAGLVHVGATLDRLRGLSVEARSDVSKALVALPSPDDLGPPRIPLPPAPARTLVSEALGSWGGLEGARRVMRAHIAQWLADGHLAIEEWLEGSATLADEVARRARAHAAVAEARSALASRGPRGGDT